MNLLQDITLATRAMVGAFVEDRTDDEGRISSDSFAGLARRIGFRAQPWEEAIKARPLRLVLVQGITWYKHSLCTAFVCTCTPNKFLVESHKQLMR